MPLPIFGKSHKSPADVVKNLKEALVAIEKVNWCILHILRLGAFDASIDDRVWDIIAR